MYRPKAIKRNIKKDDFFNSKHQIANKHKLNYYDA